MLLVRPEPWSQVWHSTIEPLCSKLIWLMVFGVKSQLKVFTSNGVARMLKSYPHWREATGTSSGYLQARPFSKWELLLKERIFSQREQILSFKSSLWNNRWPPLNVYFFHFVRKASYANDNGTSDSVLDERKPVFEVCNKVWHKPFCKARD